jgi:monoamine oxidase
MRSWELMAAQAGPRPALAGRANGTTVAMLGAGLSGLVVAYELGKLGYRVRVLEARDRVGGVSYTVRRGSAHRESGAGGETQVCSFDDGLYFNGGPWRLPNWHTGVLGYCKELSVPLEILINEDESSYPGPDRRLYLACAVVSGNGGWQEGAVAAAWTQVKQLHERVMRS